MTDLEKEKIYEIADKLGKEEILCQLSEECAELIQACLKYRRATKGLTPKTKDETFGNIVEEVSDVLLNISQILYLFKDKGIEDVIKSIQTYKTNRWWRRTFVSQDENQVNQPQCYLHRKNIQGGTRLQIIKKDGTTEQYNEQKIIDACNKAARRAMVDLSDEDYQIICNAVWEKLVENDLEEAEIYEMHNIVESVLEEHYPLVGKMYKEYRNYKKDFVHM